MNTLIPNETSDLFLNTSINLVMAYNRFCIQTKIKFRVVRKEYIVFNSICLLFEYLYSLIVTLFKFIVYNKLEPLTPTWISICQYVPDRDGIRASTYDIYSEFSVNELENWSNNPQEVLDANGPYYDIFCSKYTSITNDFKLLLDYKLEDTILIGQLCPRSTLIRFAKNANFDKDSSSFKSSSVRFLEIEYQCDNRPPIGIEVPKSHYFSGNEILSKTYVLRYLEHLPNYSNWNFYDFDYSLRIVDDNSDLFSLNCNQYIRLEEDGYKIIDIENFEDADKSEEEEYSDDDEQLEEEEYSDDGEQLEEEEYSDDDEQLEEEYEDEKDQEDVEQPEEEDEDEKDQEDVEQPEEEEEYSDDVEQPEDEKDPEDADQPEEENEEEKKDPEDADQPEEEKEEEKKYPEDDEQPEDNEEIKEN